jgi:hypothetical protein
MSQVSYVVTLWHLYRLIKVFSQEAKVSKIDICQDEVQWNSCADAPPFLNHRHLRAHHGSYRVHP